MANLTTAMAMLHRYLDSIERLMAMFPGSKHPSPDATPEIRYATAMLKEGVSREYRRRRGRIIGWERAYFEPAMHRLFMELQEVNPSTKPGAELFDALYSARLELNQSIGLLERSVAGIAPPPFRQRPQLRQIVGEA
jgi:hypothetical protein